MLDWYLRGIDPTHRREDARGHFVGPDAGERPAQSVPLNVFEGDDALVITAPVPGIEADDLTINVVGNELQLRAAERGPGQERRDYVLREWSYGPYERRITLPYDVDADRANASLGNGVLVLTLPRAEVSRPRKIALNRTGPAEGQLDQH